MSHQRQILLGELLWQEDNHGLALWQTLTKNNLAPENPQVNFAAIHFQSLSNYLKDLAVFVCPADKTRTLCPSYAALTHTNLSYFVNLTAAPDQSKAILTGDRHLETAGLPVPPGVFTLPTNTTIRWTSELHSLSKKRGGYIGFTDGHIESVPSDSLGRVFERQNLATNLLAIP